MNCVSAVTKEMLITEQERLHRISTIDSYINLPLAAELKNYSFTLIQDTGSNY